MNNIKVITVILLLAAGGLFAQQGIDSGSTAQRKMQKRALFDENGDGVKERRMERTRDRFIDANGDGICDSRERGLGFRRGKEQGLRQSGKQQQQQQRGKQ